MNMAAVFVVSIFIFIFGFVCGAAIFNGPEEPESKYWTDYIKKD